eukprot:103655-Heterocapsa_arctica.AAC.1
MVGAQPCKVVPMCVDRPRVKSPPDGCMPNLDPGDAQISQAHQQPSPLLRDLATQVFVLGHVHLSKPMCEIVQQTSWDLGQLLVR